MAEVVVSLQASLEQQQKHDNLAEPSNITGFTWKIHKYLVSATKEGPRPHLKRFTYNEMVSATENFGVDTCLSHKSYRLVCKGWIDKTTYSPSEDNIGLPVVIRQMKFLDEVDRKKLEELKKFSHPNLVQLIGYFLKCDNIVFLVHQFVPNGNFKDLLCDGAVARLTLVKKVKIAVGIARGIVFLRKTEKHITNLRLDRHNILLDEEYMVKLSDYDVIKLVLGDNYLGMRKFLQPV
ncbi:hypothetical protein L1887_38335 [Cichorium endivia]|nr:hypothetical protein L1887_38335 [Cichorium endivia]